MQYLKKLLAATLVFAMTMAFVPAASALDFNDSEDVKNVEAVELLVSLGVIKGHDDGRFDPQGHLTRAEAAKIIYVATRGEDDGGKIFAGSNLFSDVPRGLWSQGYINYASVMEFVEGHGDGTFDPDGNITGYEFLKILLCALGYDQEAEGFIYDARWQYNVLTVALKKGLTAGFSGDLAQPLERDTAALFAANTVYATTVRYDTNMRPQSTGVTFGEANLGLTTISGILVANDKAALDGQKITEEGSIIAIGDKTVLVPLSSERIMLGSAVDALVSVKNGSTLIAEDGSYNSAAIAKGFGEVRVDSERTVELDITKDKTADDVEYYINYKKADKAAFDALGAGHRVRAISNDGDNKIDMVIVEKMSFGEVSNVTSTGTVTVGGSRYNKDNAVGLEELKKGDKVLYLSIEGGMTHFEKPETVVGTASAYTDKYVMIDGTRYEPATGVAGFKTADAPLGKEATYFLLDGKIVGCSAEAVESPINYALALRATRVGWEWRVELVGMDGKKTTYVLANADDVISNDKLAYGLYDLKVNEDGEAELKAVDTTGHSSSDKIEFVSGTPRIGDKFVTSKTIMFLEIENEWKVFTGMANIPSFTAEAAERTIYGSTEDLYGTDDLITIAVISNVKLADEESENHFIVLGDVLNIADGKQSFAAWDGTEIKNFTSTAEGIVSGGVYKFTLNAAGDSVTKAEAVNGEKGVLTHADGMVLRLATAGTTDAQIITYTKDTKVIIVDLKANTAEAATIADLSTVAADAVEEMEESEQNTMVVTNDKGDATHVYQFIGE